MVFNKKSTKYDLSYEKRFQERQGHCQQKRVFSVTIDSNHLFV
jgi:hypothetical protein